MSQEDSYEDFSTGQRWGTWALNSLVPGLGSYIIMKDYRGGTFQLVTGLVGYGLIIGGSIVETTSIRRDFQPGMITGWILLGSGGLSWTINGIYNIFRSAFYHKPRPKTASLSDPEAWNIVFFPVEKSIGVHLSYTMRF